MSLREIERGSNVGVACSSERCSSRHLPAAVDPCLPCHLCRSKEVAYAPAIVARVLQPELTAAQKAVLRRSMRINSISRYEAGDARAR